MAIRSIAALSALLFIGLAASAEAGDDRTRFRCGAEGAGDISMDAKYETRGTTRRKFSVEFEAAPGGAFADGDKLTLQVKGPDVGTMTLDAIVGGDLVGDINYDTQPTEADADPFPSNFPRNLGRGDRVRLKRGDRVILACVLR